MLIVAEQAHKQCADGRVKKEYLLSEPFTQELAGRLEPFGSVYIMDFSPKPLFTFVRKPNMNMRAVIGDRKLEIWYEPADLPIAEPEILRLLCGKPC
ncbi:MAG: hypothetical protein WC342_04470 [Methanoregula sp.]|jgi:hypothetical protein